MWNKSKTKNRRLERRHVLDVKMRSQHTRAVRIRLASTIFLVCICVCLTVITIWKGSEWALDELVFENPSFGIRQVDIHTDGDIPISQIRLWAGIKEGDNLFALDIFKIKRDLELISVIKSAAVERVLPDLLRIRVVEREPVAQVIRYEARGQDGVIKPWVCYIDEGGYVIEPLSIRRSEAAVRYLEALPVLMGIASGELVPAKRVESRQLQAALKFISSFGKSQMAGYADIKSIDLSVPEILQIASRQGNEITFHVDSLDSQLRRWRLIHDYAIAQGKAIAFLDLSVSNNVPARWQESGEVVPPPKPVKPSRYPKKHV